MTSSPSNEQHIKLSDNEFGFGTGHVKPLIEVSFNRISSGKDLISIFPLVNRSIRPTSEPL